MTKIFDARLADYAEDLLNIIGAHEGLLREYEDKRLEFNALYKKIWQKKIKPIVLDVLEKASSRGHWVETHVHDDAQYIDYIHQTYTIFWKTGGYCTLSIVGKFDYNRVFFVVVEFPEMTTQQGLMLTEIHPEDLEEWLIAALPRL